MDFIKDAVKITIKRRERAVTAILAIAAGVFVLITTAAVSLYFKELSSGILKSFNGRIFLCEKRNFWIGGGLISEEKLPAIMETEHVRDVVPMLFARMETEEIVTMGVPFTAVGIDVEKMGVYIDKERLLAGELPQNGNEVLIGWDIANLKNIKTGGFIDIRKKSYLVSGILRKNNSIMDRQALVGLKALQKQTAREHLLTVVVILPDESRNIPLIKRELERKISYLTPLTEKEIESGLKESGDFWDNLTFIFILLSAVSSFLSISTVTSMAVTERKKEIAVKKAIGADNLQIMVEFISESSVITFIGWLIGLLLSLGFISLSQSLEATKYASVFKINLILILISLLWSLFLSLLATVSPLGKIVNMNIASAIRK